MPYGANEGKWINPHNSVKLFKLVKHAMWSSFNIHPTTCSSEWNAKDHTYFNSTNLRSGLYTVAMQHGIVQKMQTSLMSRVW